MQPSLSECVPFPSSISHVDKYSFKILQRWAGERMREANEVLIRGEKVHTRLVFCFLLVQCRRFQLAKSPPKITSTSWSIIFLVQTTAQALALPSTIQQQQQQQKKKRISVLDKTARKMTMAAAAATLDSSPATQMAPKWHPNVPTNCTLPCISLSVFLLSVHFSCFSLPAAVADSTAYVHRASAQRWFDLIAPAAAVPLLFTWNKTVSAAAAAGQSCVTERERRSEQASSMNYSGGQWAH